MDNRKTLLNKIARIIAFYAANIQSNVKSGRTDILIDAEEICCALLNRTFGFELKLLNQAKRNSPAIDMADEQRRVAVQVTSSNTRAKVQNTLNSFLEHGLNDQYATLLVFILVSAPKFRQRVDFFVPDGMELKIMTFLDLIRELETVERERLEEVAKYLEETIGTDKASSSADAVTTTVSADVIKGLTEDARQVFNFAGFLSEAGLERNVFEYGLEPLQRKALPDLLEQGVLYQKDTIIRLHPDVRNQAQVQAVQDHALFLDRLWDYEKSWHWDRVSLSREIALQRSLAQVYALAAELFSERAVVYALRSAELYRNTQQYEQALRQEQKALQILESVEKDYWGAARAHHFSGECYAALQEYASALKEWEKTLSLCKGPLHVFSLDLAEAYHNVGRVLAALEQYNDAEPKLLNALKLLEDFRKSCLGFAPQPWMKEIYDSLSSVYTKLNLNLLAALCSQNSLLLPTEQKRLWKHLSKKRKERLSGKPSFDLPLRSALDEHSFVGREEELANIKKRFETEQIVILSGLGGMGKTELSVRFGRDYEQSDAGWVYFASFRKDFFHTVTDEIAPGIARLEVWGQDEDMIYREALELLRKCSRNDLLILDNADTDPEGFGRLLDELHRLPMRVLITTRYDAAGAVNVTALHRQALHRIFDGHGADIHVVDKDALIDAVGGHTLTVDLIARLLGNGHCSVTPVMLLAILADRDPGIDSLANAGINDSLVVGQARIFERLRTIFQAAKLSGDAVELLRCATLLPDGGIDSKLFLMLFDEDMRDALYDLSRNGWLIWKNDLIHVPRSIQMICREMLDPTDDHCGAFLDGLWNRYDPAKYDKKRYSQLAELFSRAADLLEDRSGKCAYRAGVLWNALGQTQQALKYGLISMEKKEQGQPDSGELAAAYGNVGSAYGALGDRRCALEYHMKALTLQENVLPAGDPALAVSYHNVGRAIGDLGDHRKSLEYMLKALIIREKSLPPEHPDIARSCNAVGALYGILGDYQRALDFSQKALAILDRVLPPGHPELAESYRYVGRAYSDLGEHKRALEYMLKALSIQQRILPSEHPDIAQSCNDVGYIYSALGDHRKALEYIQKALTIREVILPADHPDHAFTYSNMGHTYGDLGDHKKSLEYHLKAYAIFEKILPADHPELAASCSNVAWGYHAVGQFDLAARYMRRAADIISRSSLPQTHPQRVNIPKWAQQIESEAKMHQAIIKTMQGFRGARFPLGKNEEPSSSHK